jgi:pimeloyl-ACP methyl ester carboxylesterase
MDVSTFTAHRWTLASEAGDIAYTEIGPEAAPVALFVHGVGISSALWRHVIEALADRSRCVAIDLPVHGGSAPRDEQSVSAMAEMVAELCDRLGLGQVDLVGNDTGGAICQVFAARHPERLRSLALTNCDTDGNFPPQAFAPIVELARQGRLAAPVAALTGDPAAWRTSPIAGLYEDPAAVPDEVWREYLIPTGGTPERARAFERLIAAFDPADLAAAGPGLRALRVPTLLVWGTGEPSFDVKWAYQLRDMIPGARDVIEVDGAKLFFPEERPGDLIPHLRTFWAR